jgi:hypothetical protein
MLERGVDLVPCPQCGYYQQNMIPRARRKHRRWIMNAGVCLILACIPFAALGAIFNDRQGVPQIPWISFITIFGIPMLVGIALITLKLILSYRYDPNSQDVEVRKALGQKLTLPPEEVARLRDAERQAKPPSDISPIKPRGVQIVGEICLVCGQRVGSVLEGHFCSGCGYAVHSKCVLKQAASSGSACLICGGDPAVGSGRGQQA